MCVRKTINIINEVDPLPLESVNISQSFFFYSFQTSIMGDCFNDLCWLLDYDKINILWASEEANLSVEELQGLKLGQTGFILAYEALSQLVGKSKDLYQVKKKDYVGTNNEIKDDVAVNSLRKKRDKSVPKMVPFIENERLQRNIILCIHTNKRPF